MTTTSDLPDESQQQRPAPPPPPVRIRGLLILERLGGGGFGQVFKAVPLPSPHPTTTITTTGRGGEGGLLAVKVLSMPISHSSVQREVRIWRLLSQEASRFPTIDSMPVLPMYGLHASEEGHACISMRLCSGGSLADALRRHGPLAETQAMAVAHTLARALDTCHRLGVVHMDLKPANVLFPFEQCKVSCRGALLADFGLSRLLPTGASHTLVGRGAGTPGFQAPEVITDGVCSPAADAWSLGALLLQLLTARLPPCDVDDPDDLISEFKGWNLSACWLELDYDCMPPPSWLDNCMSDCPRWLALSPAARDAINGLLCPGIRRRLTPSQLLQHAWLMDEQLAHQKYLADTMLTTGITKCNPLATFSCAPNLSTTPPSHWAFAA